MANNRLTGYLGDDDGSKGLEPSNKLALGAVFQVGRFIAFKAIDPADISHGRAHAFDVKLVLHSDREAMERADWALVRPPKAVQLLSRRNSLVETNLEQVLV